MTGDSGVRKTRWSFCRQLRTVVWPGSSSDAAAAAAAAFELLLCSPLPFQLPFDQRQQRGQDAGYLFGVALGLSLLGVLGLAVRLGALPLLRRARPVPLGASFAVELVLLPLVLRLERLLAALLGRLLALDLLGLPFFGLERDPVGRAQVLGRLLLGVVQEGLYDPRSDDERPFRGF